MMWAPSFSWLHRRFSRRLPWLLAWLAVPLLSLALVWGICASGNRQSLSRNLFDHFFHWRGAQPTNQQIVIIGIDDKSLASLGMWPLPRHLHAQILDRLRQAKAVGFDILFREATPDDGKFSVAMAAGAPVFLAVAEENGSLLRPSPTLSGYAGTGHIHTPLSGDGVNRIVLPHYGGLPVLALAMTGGEAAQTRGGISLINYYGKEKTFPHLSYLDVLNGHISPEFFAGRYVLIGADTAGLGDAHATPYTHTWLSSGVEIQATILGNLLEGSFLTPLPTLSRLAALIMFALAIFLWPKLSVADSVLALIFFYAVFLATSYACFLNNIFFDPVLTLLVLTCTYIVYLSLQGLWLARRIYLIVSALGRELSSSLKNTYVTIPRQFLRIKGGHAFMGNFPGEIDYQLRRIDDGISALNIQNRFIHHLLSEAMPPIILWEKHNGAVVLASTLFRRLWQDMRMQTDLPEIQEFLALFEDDGQNPQPGRVLTGDSRPHNLTVRLPGKKPLYFQVVFQEVSAGDSFFSGIIAILTDVSELYELEKMKSEVLDVVSHEIRLPLTTILGYSEILLATLTGEHRRHAEEIHSQTQRLNRIVDSFLDIARIESGKSTLLSVPLDILAVAHDAIFAVEYAATEKEIVIDSHLPEKCSPIYGDEPQLLQAIINLLENAVKFSPRHARVSLTIREEKDHITIEVADQGSGILYEDRDRIFNKFHRGQGISRQEGFGLGLSLAHQVTLGHGGTIELLTLAPESARFLVRLPKNRRKETAR